MNKIGLLSLVVAFSLVVAGCAPASPATLPGTSQPPIGPATATGDPCLQENIRETVPLINHYMQQFDEYATLASSVIQSDLSKVIPPMEQIAKATKDQAVPSCLTDLKQYAVLYMDMTLSTLQSFQSSPEPATISAGILQARQYHQQYVAELADLVGVTLPAPTATVPPPTLAADTPTPAPPTVVNPGPNPLNLHVSPSLTAETITVLNAGQSAQAFGRSANGEWILVEIPGQPGQKAWVYSSLVQFTSGDVNAIPIATP